MKTMKKRIFAAAIALFLLAGTSVSAQETKGQQTKERPTAEQIAQRRTEKMAEKLNLNDAQKQQVYELNLEQAKKMQSHAELVRDARNANAEKMKAILTPEQYEQWKQLQSEQMHKGKQGQGDKVVRGCQERADKPCPKK